MKQRHVKITGYSSPICWWQGCLGRIATVLDVYEPTNYIKVRLTRPVEPYWVGCICPEEQREGWMPAEYVEDLIQGVIRP